MNSPPFDILEFVFYLIYDYLLQTGHASVQLFDNIETHASFYSPLHNIMGLALDPLLPLPPMLLLQKVLHNFFDAFLNLLLDLVVALIHLVP